MQKRGQVSVFFIIGIIVIAVIIFAFILFRGFQEKVRSIVNPEEYLKSQIGDIKKTVVKCIDEKSKEGLNKLALQGGHLDPIKYVNYYENKVSFLCYKIKEEDTCYNMMFTRKDIEDQLGPYLNEGIKKCITLSLEPFRNGDYSLSTGDYGLNFVFSDEALLVNLEYPITLTKGNITEVQDKFSKETKTEFWKEVEIVNTIINMESKGEVVDVSEMSPKNIYFQIARTEVVGGSLYMIVPRYSKGGIFYFAIER